MRAQVRPMLKRVNELPDTVRKSREGVVAKDVREFCRNQTYEVAEVTVINTSDAGHYEQIVQLMRQYLKRHQDQCRGVTAALRGGKAYLCREVTR